MSDDKKQDNEDLPAKTGDSDPLILTKTASADDIKQAQADSTKKEQSPARNTSVQVSKSPRAVFASLLALIAIGVALAGVYRAETQRQIIHQDMALQQQTLTGQTQQFQELTQQFQQQQTAMQQFSSAAEGMALQLDSLGKMVAANQRRIDSVAGTERSDWQLAEVEYLLRLANQRLVMSGEVRGSKALLQSADAVLLEIDDVHLMIVREAIAKDIAALNRADILDAEGLYLRVASLAENVDYLELQSDKRWRAQPSLPAMELESDEQDVWQVGINKAMSALSDLVVIRSSEQRVLPQMRDIEIMQLRQGLYFLIEQAKYAVISGKQALFDAALADLNRWVSDYYDLEQPITAATLRELEGLQSMQVEQHWPDISQSLDILKSVMKSRLGAPAKQSAQLDDVAKSNSGEIPIANTKDNGDQQ
jgi:uroporphyrin-3 C-methyltransferase